MQAIIFSLRLTLSTNEASICLFRTLQLGSPKQANIWSFIAFLAHISEWSVIFCKLLTRLSEANVFLSGFFGENFSSICLFWHFARISLWNTYKSFQLVDVLNLIWTLLVSELMAIYASTTLITYENWFAIQYNLFINFHFYLFWCSSCVIFTLTTQTSHNIW